MDQEIYIHISKQGYVIGGYVNKLHASDKVIFNPDTKMVKLTVSDENILTKNEALETIKKHREENK